MDTSSPNPLNHAATPQHQEEEAGRFTVEDLTRAEDFLQTLPEPWAAGRVTARKLAPALLDSAQAQGWDLDAELVRALTANPGAVRSYPKVLALRIADLKRKPIAAPTSTPAAVVPAVPLPPWCQDLDCDEETRYRRTTDDQGFTRTGPCPACHPATQKDTAA